MREQIGIILGRFWHEINMLRRCPSCGHLTAVHVPRWEDESQCLTSECLKRDVSCVF